MLSSPWPPSSDWALVYVSAFLVIATVALWLATKKLVKDARKNAERQLRAYVGVKGLGLGPDSLDRFGVELQNFGETPALSLAVTMSRKVLPYPIDTYAFVDDPDPDPPTSSVLNPGDKRPVQSSESPVTEITGQELDSILTKKIIDGKRTALYCYGRADFTDIFGADRWVNYCLIFGGAFPFAADHFEYCHLHNDTSEGPR